ncbi:MAG: sulfatase-like hydrolase/transferase [Crocinitomicaceae bacterium]
MRNFWSNLVAVVKIILFWVLLFDVMRLLFILHNFDKVPTTGWLEVSKAFLYSFRLDVAAASAASVLPFLFLVLWKIIPTKFFKTLFISIFSLEVLMVLFIHAGEINAYPEWNHKLNSHVFMHLANPDEVGRTASWGMVFWFLLYSSLGGIFAYFLAKKIFWNQLMGSDKFNWKSKLTAFVSFVLIAPFMVLLIRGGLQPVPINTDAAYFSKTSLANDLSVNTTYNFAKSFLLYNRSNLDDVFPVMKSKTAALITSELYRTETDSFPQILTTNRPNLVFIVLEGWSANAMKSLAGTSSVTPHFDKLTKKGLLFTRMYADGGTSEIGNACIFSAYPALPEISMSMQPDKHRKQPTLNQDLKAWNYYSGYRFSGDLKYGNIGSFFTDHGFDSVKDEKDFPPNLPKGKLNYYDEELYKLLKKDIDKTKEPFLHCAFTGSTHSPYDFPKHKNQNYVGPEEDYMNSLIYADEALHNFLQRCKKEKWYKNTLFVLISDHGHTAPEQNDPNQGKYFHIPCLLFGEALKPAWRGKTNDVIGNQHDIVGTLLAQMKGDLSRYPWSKNLLNPTVQNFALHTVTRGYGWIDDAGDFSYNLDNRDYLNQNIAPEKLPNSSRNCKGYLVHLYENYKAL